MKLTQRSLIGIISVCMISCSNNVQRTTDKNFYFEIKANQSNKFTAELVPYLKSQIPQHKYTITNTSGTTWPYYASLDLEESIPLDSLMPPHWYLHKMIFKDSNAVLTIDDHLVKIDLMLQPDTIPNYRVEIYEMDSVGLKLAATSGIHFVDSEEYSSSSLSEFCLKSIIRYSFK